MAKYLLQITIGPIQDFIPQARRTRDLWYGSHVLSELSRCVARSLAAHPTDDGKAGPPREGVTLIFPALGQPGDPPGELDACIQPFRAGGRPPLSIANIILATVVAETSEAVEKIAADARDELQRVWRDEIAEPIRQSCSELLRVGATEAWNEQIASLLEYSAVWVPYTERDYASARKELAKATAGRKNLRDFEPWEKQNDGLPKSSLDGARETVLREPPKSGERGGEVRDEKLARKYRIGKGEQLDAVGLVKRAGGQTNKDTDNHDLQFVPLVNVALAPWMQKAKCVAPSAFSDLHTKVANIECKRGLPQVLRDIPGGRMLFDRDAGIFLRNRWLPDFEELGIFDTFTSGAYGKRYWQQKVVDWCEEATRPIFAVMREPHPYVACLVADGDGMGAAIDAIATEHEHRVFSRELAKFALAARTIVEQDHLGSLVYSGGDDVLAFLPVQEAVACAGKLSASFGEIMTTANLPAKAGTPTLSVGIGIGHVLESMGDLLALGREAEKAAKAAHLKLDGPGKRTGRDRNALAIILDKRSGGRREWRCQWPTNPVKRLEDDRGLLKDRLSTRKVYQIAAILRRLPAPSADVDQAFVPVLVGEVQRTLERAEKSCDRLTLSDVGLAFDEAATYKVAHAAVSEWIDRVLIAGSLRNAANALEPR